MNGQAVRYTHIGFCQYVHIARLDKQPEINPFCYSVFNQLQGFLPFRCCRFGSFLVTILYHLNNKNTKHRKICIYRLNMGVFLTGKALCFPGFAYRWLFQGLTQKATSKTTPSTPPSNASLHPKTSSLPLFPHPGVLLTTKLPHLPPHHPILTRHKNFSTAQSPSKNLSIPHFSTALFNSLLKNRLTNHN